MFVPTCIEKGLEFPFLNHTFLWYVYFFFFFLQQSPITFIIGEKEKAWKKETASVKRGSGDCNIKKLESV